MGNFFVTEAINAIKALVKGWDSHGPVVYNLYAEEEFFSRHLSFVESWSRQVSLKDLPRSRFLSEIFIQLGLSERASRANASLDPDHLLLPGFHSILLGHPGAGKTTIVKHLCQCLLHEAATTDDEFSFPILVLLRDLRQEESLVDRLLSIVGIRVEFPGLRVDNGVNKQHSESEGVPASQIEARTRVLAAYLNTSRALILLDGLDEVRAEHGLRIQRELLLLANLLNTSKFVLTCRIGVLEVAFDNSEVLYVCPLDRQQIITFTKQWLESDTEAGAFLDAVERSPYRDTIGRPLVLVNLCMVYQSYGELPEPPTLIYQKVIQLLLEQWDRQRDLRRVSRYGRFGPERKRQFLGALAYELATRYRVSSKYEDGELKGAYRLMHSSFGLPLEEREQVVAEIESHTGLFVRTGLGEFEFSHKSLQEYLCADHICRLPDLRADLEKLIQLPNECAIATVLSASPDGLFELLAFNLVKPTIPIRYTANLTLGFWNPYLTRLRIEGATFAEGARLGLAFLLIASLAWIPVEGEASKYRAAEGSHTLLELLDGFLSQRAVSASLHEAAGSYFVSARSEQCVEARVKAIRKNSLPLGMADTLVVSKKYIQAAANS